MSYVDEQALLAIQQGMYIPGQKDILLNGYKLTDSIWASNTSTQDFEWGLSYLDQDFEDRSRRFFQDFWRIYYAFGETGESIGYQPGFGPVFGWVEGDMAMKQAQIRNIITTAFPATTVILELQNTKQLFEAKDLLNVPRGGTYQVRVQSSALVGGYEQITVTRVSGTAMAAADFVIGDKLGWNGNSWEENSFGPTHTFETYPTPKYGRYSTIRGVSGLTGDAMTTGSNLVYKSLGLPSGDGIVMTKAEFDMFRLFRDNREMTIMMSESSDAAAYTQTGGLLRTIQNHPGNVVGYATSIDDADFRAFFDAKDIVTQSDKFLFLMGGKAWNASQSIFQGLLDNGAQTFQPFDPKSYTDVGISVRSYTFGNKMSLFTHYRLFDDANFMGSATTDPTITTVDYKDYVLAINLMTSHQVRETVSEDKANIKGPAPYVTIKYKQLGSVDRSLVVGFSKGMTGADSGTIGFGDPRANVGVIEAMNQVRMTQVNTSQDADRTFVLGQYGVRVAYPQAHGILRRTS